MSAPSNRRKEPAAPQAVSPALKAIGLMVLCGVFFGVLNATQKSLAHQMYPPQVLCLRYFAGSAVLIPLAIHSGWNAYRPHRLGLMLPRGVVHVAGSMIWFSVLPYVTLAEQSAIGFTGPIFMMLGAWLFLGERMYAARWAAVLLAFLGVLIVIWPGLTRADVGSLYSAWLLVASGLFAASFLLSKSLTRYDSPAAIVFWLGIMIGVMSLPFAVFAIRWPAGAGPALDVVWQWPTAAQWGLFLFCGLVGTAGHYSMTRAYQIADVSVVQPMRYLDLVWASVFGFIVFRDLPTAWTLVGGSVICAATLWIARRETRRPPAP